MQNLDCANCADKLEKKIQKLEGVASAWVSFATKTLVLECCLPSSELAKTLQSIADSVEPGITVVEKNAAQSPEHAPVITKGKVALFAAGTALFVAGLVLELNIWLEFALFFASYLLIGGHVILTAGKNILKGDFFDENFLMSIATIGAFAIKEFPEGVAVMLFYRVGEFFQDLAVNRSRRSIAALMDIRPDFANVKTGDDIETVAPEQVKIGDIIIIKPGEKVPLDAVVMQGQSMLDTSALTGESMPRDVGEGDPILSGAINLNGLLTAKVTKEYGQSTAAKILDLVQNAASKKAPTENFITKFARFYTPAVVFLAASIAVAPPLLGFGGWADWINRGLIFLVVSCPCALVISIPLGFFGGIGGASKKGVLIKGSNFLEALNNVDTVVFDKTGTLTMGVFKVVQIKGAQNMSDQRLLELAAYAENFSNHPIATSIKQAYTGQVDPAQILNYTELPGHGISAQIQGGTVLAGNAKLMESQNIQVEQPEAVGTVVHLAENGVYAGHIVIADQIKPDSKTAIEQLRRTGVRRIVMLTGDTDAVGQSVARELGIDLAYTELLPDQKVEMLEQLEKTRQTGGRLVSVGDGINDAPLLARADVGVAMGGLGSDAAIEAADVVLMTDQPSKLAEAIKTAKRTKGIVWQNIAFALGVKGVVMVLGAWGLANMWEAVFADVGVAVLAILNAMRVMKD